jgi:acetyl-CoA carboxylase biotin carboxyl carrier protein
VEEKQITQLMLAMRRTGIKKLVLKKEKEGIEIQLEREDRSVTRAYDPTMLEALEENPMRVDFEKHRSQGVIPATQHSTKEHALKAVQPAQEDKDVNAVYVTSPMVGTIYFAPSPNDPFFVKAGDKVDKNTVVCIIEAMKVMNEVKAGASGVISEPLVENGQPVEFGTKLFRLISTT